MSRVVFGGALLTLGPDSSGGSMPVTSYDSGSSTDQFSYWVKTGVSGSASAAAPSTA